MFLKPTKTRALESAIYGGKAAKSSESYLNLVRLLSQANDDYDPIEHHLERENPKFFWPGWPEILYTIAIILASTTFKPSYPRFERRALCTIHRSHMRATRTTSCGNFGKNAARGQKD
jgi:hypothetical protein